MVTICQGMKFRFLSNDGKRHTRWLTIKPTTTQVFTAYQSWKKEYDDISVLDTRTFLQGLKLGAVCVAERLRSDK